MILHHQKDLPIFVIGNGCVADQTYSLISCEHDSTVMIEPDHVDSIPSGSQCVMGFMNHFYRNQMLNKTLEKRFVWPTYIHATAYIADKANIGRGVIIMDHVHLGYGSTVGNWCFLDSKVTLAHNSRLGKNCVLTLGTTVGGSATIGDNVVAGLNTTFCDKILICSDVKFAMCSIVSKSIDQSGTYYGTKKISSVRL